jgi:multimeric flavodoxin WrbA
MLVLGLQGSPRKKGNSATLLNQVMAEVKMCGDGVRTQIVDIPRRKVLPCAEIGTCEINGTCPIKDDMQSDIYGLLREADVVVAATPVFFYNMTAQLKALVDRCQTLWSRKYRLKLKDPGCRQRIGLLLSVAATKGKNLFEAIELSTRYFYDAIDAKYAGSLTYRNIEKKGDMSAHPDMAADVADMVKTSIKPLSARQRILFAGTKNDCYSQMAAAFARQMAGDRLDVLSAGSEPAEKINPEVEEVMAQIGIDLGYGRPKQVKEAYAEHCPDRVVVLGDIPNTFNWEGIKVNQWQVDRTDQPTLDFLKQTRENIHSNVKQFIDEVV